MRNTQKISINTALFEEAKKDYATGFYSWHDLKQKYNLPLLTVFKIIFEVRGDRK